MSIDFISILIKRSLFLMVFLIVSASAFSTHNRAGEIIYEKIQGEKFKITIITFTEINNQNADRDTLELNFGDGTSAKVKRTTREPGYKGYTNFQRNTYTTTHTYPGPGTYLLSMLDPNRNGGVVNIPNSIERKFYIESYLNITLGESNNSVILTRDPIAFACNNVPFYHNPGAYDPDGDSLSFELVPCKADYGLPIPDYKFPAASKVFKIDPITGLITWDTPIMAGEYNIAILVTEYRKVTTANGTKKIRRVGSVLRDMQITVYSTCTNKPPQISKVPNYCVQAGDSLRFTVIASDTIDGFSNANGSSVNLQAYGGPFEIPEVAKFSVQGVDPAIGTFYWEPGCNHVRNRPYLMTFEAIDNGIPELSNYTSSSIRVVAPPVENVTAEAISSSIDLTWDREICSEAIGYRIYRKSGSTGFVPDSCEIGVPDYLGYNLIYEGTELNELSYNDDNDGQGLIPGVVYCYLIVAYFADGAESYASKEVCARLKKDVPILTNVDDSTTSTSNGIVLVKWSKPTDHNTVAYPGPYKYRVYRTEKRKFDQFVLIDSLFGIDDTSFMDVGLNTQDIEYTYKIELMDQSQAKDRSMGFSVLGTSIYLSSVSKDRRLILKWDELVPWSNESYTIYKRNDSGEFDSLTTISENQYIDSNLKNLKEYCYKVVSTGSYSLNSIAKPLINRSQIHCDRPVDRQAPCPPELDLFADDCAAVEEILNEQDYRCKNGSDTRSEVEEVSLRWTNPNKACDTTDDVHKIELFYRANRQVQFRLLWTVKLDTANPDNQEHEFNFIHQGESNTRAGCYYVVATDVNGNESPTSDTLCIENCLIYSLPNVFTPNNDGINDLFTPFPYCYVKEVEMKIFNRWGKLVFETNDPDVNWDGMNQFTNTAAPDGVYYYTSLLKQISVDGIKEVELKGIVHILGTEKSPNQ